VPDLPKALFSCDPGLVSGIAELWYLPEDELIDVHHSAEVGMAGVGSALRQFCQASDPYTAQVVAERFIITPKTGTNSQAPWSLETIGMMRWIVHEEWGLPIDDAIVLQSAVEAKTLVTNDVLKRIGVWHRGGAGHAKDALRHGVFRYAKLGLRTPWKDL
jgi:hypothetical protein